MQLHSFCLKSRLLCIMASTTVKRKYYLLLKYVKSTLRFQYGGMKSVVFREKKLSK